METVVNINRTKSPRDERIDSIRGILLILMAVGHFGGAITFLTWEPFWLCIKCRRICIYFRIYFFSSIFQICRQYKNVM